MYKKTFLYHSTENLVFNILCALNVLFIVSNVFVAKTNLRSQQYLSLHVYNYLIQLVVLVIFINLTFRFFINRCEIYKQYIFKMLYGKRNNCASSMMIKSYSVVVCNMCQPMFKVVYLEVLRQI